jgi:hypothetical protein
MRTFVASVVLLGLAVTATVQAQGQSALRLSDEQVRRLVVLALNNIGHARCANNQPCAAATAEEKSNPPIAADEVRLAFNRGALSGAGQHCGLDWQSRNFAPMMRYWRATMKKNERQAALLGLLHGIAQDMAKPDGQTVCTTRARENVDRLLAFRP